jgi:hypothetical protein
MSSPKGKQAAGSGVKPKEGPASISLALAHKMIPLVAQVVRDVHFTYSQLTKLEMEQEDLDRRRRNLDWPERQRRYQVAEDIRQQQQRLTDGVVELEQISVLMVDPVVGEAAFPTMVHGKQAYFVYRMGSDQLTWCYANEPERRSIPSSWLREPARKA